eukprot:2306292-Pleurochrysis_carterae.AAC.2
MSQETSEISVGLAAESEHPLYALYGCTALGRRRECIGTAEELSQSIVRLPFLRALVDAHTSLVHGSREGAFAPSKPFTRLGQM